MPDHDSLFEEDALPAPEEPGEDEQEKTSKPGKRQPSFEQSLERLEAIVAEMESGELSLDESMKRFEEGAKLAAYCRKSLQSIEKRVEVLVKKQDTEAWEPFEE